MYKVQCYTVQGQYRYIKPKTLLEKLNQYNECQKDALKDFQNKTNLKQIVVEKYTKLYPNAVVTVKSDWTKYSGSFEVIEVKFESGSYEMEVEILEENFDDYFKKYPLIYRMVPDLNAVELIMENCKNNKISYWQYVKKEISYQQLKDKALSQIGMFDGDPSFECFCNID